ncbi:phosphonate ABC transporter ATP-binding protein [Piscicoccus intestinalis]|uniref:phosphonate ABC transporter ATP-binding protein n=1 Tax=Piscicoccus intestinalis TaxID=746033 RepID=UPI000838F738|nr:ATP-binding cassette domain-containing protein [Piscicoccus intestinalis]
MTALRLRGITLRYGAGAPALADVDLEVAPGERVGLVGPSGAGKSSLLRLCAGMLAPQSGMLEVLGADPAGLRPRARRALRSRIGTVHQHLDLVGPLRVVHNVNAGRLGRWGSARGLVSLLRPLDVAAVDAALAQVGLDGMRDRRTDRLSGGEQQRVALARVLVQDPDLVLADEPVSSLDPVRAEAVLSLLTGVVAGRSRTLLVSLHDIDLAVRRCERLVGLRAGRIVFDLPASEVGAAERAALYRAGP